MQALVRVDLAVERGEIHALRGENGAGKSTLIKALTGVFPREAGEALLDGVPINPKSPRAAERLGISTVYQEINLIPDLSVAENICLGRQPVFLGAIRWGSIARRTRPALSRLDLKIDVSRQLSSYSIAIQQLVAIARALDISAKLLILDEPTSGPDAGEAEELLKILRKLRADGLGILFVTHFVEQVYKLCDSVTILRNGRLVGRFPIKELPRVKLVAHMMGKELQEVEALAQKRAHTASIHKETALLNAIALGRKGSTRWTSRSGLGKWSVWPDCSAPAGPKPPGSCSGSTNPIAAALKLMVSPRSCALPGRPSAGGSR